MLSLGLQNKINSEGGALCLSSFVSCSHNDRKGPQEHDTFAYSTTIKETMENFCPNRTATR